MFRVLNNGPSRRGMNMVSYRSNVLSRIGVRRGLQMLRSCAVVVALILRTAALRVWVIAEGPLHCALQYHIIAHGTRGV